MQNYIEINRRSGDINDFVEIVKKRLLKTNNPAYTRWIRTVETVPEYLSIDLPELNTENRDRLTGRLLEKCVRNETSYHDYLRGSHNLIFDHNGEWGYFFLLDETA